MGAATSQSAHMAASVASRYALSADGVGAARPGARGSQVTASRYALGAEGGAAARPGAYMCSPRYCARCLLGGVGMSKTSCAARCSRGSVQRVLRAPAEGEGGAAHLSLAIYSGERRTLQLLLTHTLITFRCYHPALLHCNRLLRGVQVSAR